MSKSTFEMLKKLGNRQHQNASHKTLNLDEPQLKMNLGCEMGNKLAELLRYDLNRDCTPMD